MAKKKARSEGKPKTSAKRKHWSSQRGRTIPSNGSVEAPIVVAPEPEPKIAIAEAMRLAVEKLGDLKVNDDLAPQQLRELGELCEDITRRQAAYDAKAEEAKTAKKSLESAQELLIEKVRTFTHPNVLPLFDETVEEDARAEMIAGGDVEELGLEPAIQ
jgi:hypothetical protein